MNPTSRIRAVICDALFRRDVAEMLATTDDIEVVAEADTHKHAVAASEKRLGVVLLNLEVPGMRAEVRCGGCWSFPPAEDRDPDYSRRASSGAYLVSVRAPTSTKALRSKNLWRP